MVSKTALTILVSIILTVISISLVNVGTSIFLEEPEYSDYCNDSLTQWKENMTDKEIGERSAYLDECREAYDDALKPYNQYRYYIFAGIGFVLLLVGLFSKENLVQISGLATGGILVAEGIVVNLENKWIVFLSLLAILAIFGVLAYRIINSSGDKKSTKKKK